MGLTSNTGAENDRLLGRMVRITEGTYIGLVGRIAKYWQDDGRLLFTVVLTLPKNDEPPELREIEVSEPGFFGAMKRERCARRAYADDPQPLKSIWTKTEEQPDGTRRCFACRQARGDEIYLDTCADQV